METLWPEAVVMITVLVYNLKKQKKGISVRIFDKERIFGAYCFICKGE